MLIDILQSLRPTTKPRVIDLVAQTGMDVTGWSDFKGEHAATNPRYAYRWSFLEPGKFVIALLFHEDLEIVDDAIVHEQNIRLRDGRLGGKGASQWKGRADELDEYLRIAYQEGLPVRAIILDGDKRDHLDAEAESSKVKARLLDSETWAVQRYNVHTGECLLVRGAEPTASSEQEDPEIEGFEGEERRRYVLHRRREASLRRKKIQIVLYERKALRCEVPNCGFDFAERYGTLGESFAHVHHLLPLSAAPAEGQKINIKDLAIVCANCHAMIHRGGKCRPLDGLIPASGTQTSAET